MYRARIANRTHSMGMERVRVASDVATSFKPRRCKQTCSKHRTHAKLKNTTAAKRTGLDTCSFSLREQKPTGVSRRFGSRSVVFGRRRVAGRNQ